MLNWVSRFSIFSFLDNHDYTSLHHQHDCLLAAGAAALLQTEAGTAFEQLKDFAQKNNDWLFGHLSYDLKNETEQLSSQHPDGVGFADLCFFVPQTVVEMNDGIVTIHSLEAPPAAIFEAISQCSGTVSPAPVSLHIQPRISRSTYLTTIHQLQQHIRKGDCYEINFCQEFFADGTRIEPLPVFLALCTVSPNPFAAFYRINHQYLLCASPERYLKKTGQQLISQPIKGTWQRNRDDAAADVLGKKKLYNSQKERSENVMVVDIVRNDLSRVCTEGSVKVDELFGIYSFPQVHQMISTISGRLRDELHFTDALKASFPMGSMTGAPKKRVMELIEQYECRRRGLFAGSVGYITPGGDFDFNVVIRSMLYNHAAPYLSYQVGSGITVYSNPEQEYEECMLKAAAIEQVLGGGSG
jgi:para-aminobenzoate synthetase component I